MTVLYVDPESVSDQKKPTTRQLYRLLATMLEREGIAFPSSRREASVLIDKLDRLPDWRRA
jgi:hypothetical protein